MFPSSKVSATISLDKSRALRLHGGRNVQNHGCLEQLDKDFAI